MVRFGALSRIKSVVLFLILLACCEISLARGIKVVTIDEVGIVRPESDQKDEALIVWCRAFRPTFSQVRRYFANAVPVPPVVTSHDRYSPCAAKGTVTFKDGFRADWILYSDGSARIDWQAGGHVYLLLKDNKWHDPIGSYDQG
ncbi:hypothetical protein NK8_37530 [Caballeronia sp. NK8]|uniref:hypothetical protein n=1 Tax=Caballeronia sp. NK8 TaxID=140098 RepID=UPI001BB5C3AD|nr:hypothetical protein [Caballeronia sp. NK8]BCQ25575.1 hypothetical protein NK8_37530 [Caballeronia sp. NK8]